MSEPVYGHSGKVAFWITVVDQMADDIAAFHRQHLLRRYYDWHHTPSRTTGRATGFFLDLESYTSTLIRWNRQSREWTYTP